MVRYRLLTKALVLSSHTIQCDQLYSRSQKHQQRSSDLIINFSRPKLDNRIHKRFIQNSSLYSTLNKFFFFIYLLNFFKNKKRRLKNKMSSKVMNESSMFYMDFCPNCSNILHLDDYMGEMRHKCYVCPYYSPIKNTMLASRSFFKLKVSVCRSASYVSDRTFETDQFVVVHPLYP